MEEPAAYTPQLNNPVEICHGVPIYRDFCVKDGKVEFGRFYSVIFGDKFPIPPFDNANDGTLGANTKMKVGDSLKEVRRQIAEVIP